jgi:DNA polymerase III epsilon subunit-like protein
MNNIENHKIMVLDTEYDTTPKRLLALAYIIYHDQVKIKEEIMYVKHDPKVFKVNQYGDAFKFHKLTNKFLQDNGKNLEEVMNVFYNDIKDINIVIGQNIISADLSLLRKESIATRLWDNKMDKIFRKIKIYDTMKIFKKSNYDESAALNNIYKILLNKDIENHHEALSDCRTTYECFDKMKNDDKYKLKTEKYEYSEIYFDKLLGIKKNCNICSSKILDSENSYILRNKGYKNKKGIFTFHNSDILNQDEEICSKCLSRIELEIYDVDDNFIDMILLKKYDELIPKFFQMTGDKYVNIYLESKYKDKNEIKKLGGRWDSNKRKWYFKAKENDSIILHKFRKWLPKGNKKTINL